MLGVYCPTYRRPHKLQAVADNLTAVTTSPLKLYWGVEPGDKASIKAAKATGHTVVINKGKQGYSDTAQTIYEKTKEPIFFVANDDFIFLDGWEKAPLEYLQAHPEIMVLGVHDGNPHTRFYTISFIRRRYIQEQSGVVDVPGRVFFPYKHNYQDTEFSETAISRGVWASIPNPCIEHHHPSLSHVFGDTPNDETYDKNNATSAEDGNTYAARRHLW